LGEIPSKDNQSVSVFFKAFFLTLSASFILTIPIVILADLKLIIEVERPVQIILSRDYSLNTVLVLTSLAGVIHPIIEELAFRYSLVFSKENEIAIGVSFIISAALAYFYDFFAHIKVDLGWYSFSVQFILFTITLIPVIKRLLNIANLTTISHFVKSNTKLLTFIFSTLFALAHIETTHTTDYYILYLIIFLPFFFSGYIFSFIRCWLGLKYSILLHGSHNFLLIIFTLINHHSTML
jgi:hypothetical protein